MTKKEAAIVSAFTGVLIGDFSTMKEYIEEKLDRPVFTHEMASKAFTEKLKAATKEDFVNISVV